jgi:hypothetical protein
LTTETKEHAALAWPDPDPGDVDQATGAHAQASVDARANLAAEWRAAHPVTPDEIRGFYQRAQGLAADLEAWHATPERQEWTRMLVHVATQATGDRRQATEGWFRIVDIGCGAGHDLRALRQALPDADLWAVEPNDALRQQLAVPDQGIAAAADVAFAPVELAHLLVCIDVLEHVPDPETFLGGIAQRAPLGCLLFETTATHDTGTPLHLPANRGWHPGRVLERHGWELVDYAGSERGRVRVWRRERTAGTERASLLLCAYRNVAVSTLCSIMDLCAGGGTSWRLKVKAGDALIARSRSIIVTDWWRSTNDDVFVMLDDDITFGAADAERLAQLCRDGYDIVCGAYPVRDGAHLSCRTLPGTGEIHFGPDEPPIEIQYAATGFMACHRRVVDALVMTLPLCHAPETWSFHPLFSAMTAQDADADLSVYLSEDYGFSQLARQLGFLVWLDPQTKLQHRAEVGISVQNMAAVQTAIQQI